MLKKIVRCQVPKVNTQFIEQDLFYCHTKTQHKMFFKTQNGPRSMWELMLYYFETAVLITLLRKLE